MNTKLKVSVTQLEGSNGPVKNQFIIRTDEGEYFQSYQSIIAFRPRTGKILLDEKYWDYSSTTGKYRNIFLGETKRETEQKIRAEQYLLTDLN